MPRKGRRGRRRENEKWRKMHDLPETKSE